MRCFECDREDGTEHHEKCIYNPKVQAEWAALEIKVRELLPEYEIERSTRYPSSACCVDVNLGFGRGSVTLCLHRRRWAPGGGTHGAGQREGGWFDVPNVRAPSGWHGYTQEDWLEQICLDLREGHRRLIQALLDEEHDEGWGLSPERKADLLAAQEQLGKPDASGYAAYCARVAALKAKANREW